MTEISSKYNFDKLPRHVAIIMDGNGRWAQAKGLPRSQGHIEGVSTVRRITEAASRIGIECLTLYAFSTENWNRPKEEVDALMHLIVLAIERETPDLIKNNVRLSMIGDASRMPHKAIKRLQQCIADTSACTGLNLVLAISYSSRWEIVNACRNIASMAVDGSINSSDIDDKLFSESLSTAGLPDPDLLIRTGGDMRVSNFLLWQIAYAEIFVTHTYWPDFSENDFYKALQDYSNRQRRFGLTAEQLK